MCVRACVRSCVRACVRASVCARARVCVFVCVCVCVCVWGGGGERKKEWLIKTGWDEGPQVKVSGKWGRSRDPSWPTSLRVTPFQYCAHLPFHFVTRRDPPREYSQEWSRSTTASGTMHNRSKKTRLYLGQCTIDWKRHDLFWDNAQ